MKNTNPRFAISTEGLIMKEKKSIKIFKPALGFDFETGIAHVAVPFVVTEKDSKKKTVTKIKIYIVNSDKECWPITEEEKEKRSLYPDSLPIFGKNEMRWAREYVRKFLTDDSSKKALDPYQEVFIPIKECLEKHVEFINPDYSIIITLWIIGTYIFPIFEAYPYLLFSGTRGSGKTKLMEILYKLSFNAEITSNASPASIFRLIEANLSTFLIDEGEMFSGKDRDKEIILLLNAGYKRSGFVTRANKDTHQPEKFTVYSPKAVAAINPLDNTLLSRFITLTMIKTAAKDKGNIRVTERSADWDKLRDSLYRFALICGFDVSEIFEKSDKIQLLNCRNNELWSPLLAIAEYIDTFTPEPYLFENLSRIALKQTDEEDSLDEWHDSLLRSLHALVYIKKPYLVRDVKNGMSQFFEDTSEFVKVTNHWVANALKRFGFRPAKRANQGARYILDPEKIKDLVNRYEISVNGVDSDDDNSEDDNGNDDGNSTPPITTPITPIAPEQQSLTDDDKRWIDENVEEEY